MARAGKALRRVEILPEQLVLRRKRDGKKQTPENWKDRGKYIEKQTGYVIIEYQGRYEIYPKNFGLPDTVIMKRSWERPWKELENDG